MWPPTTTQGSGCDGVELTGALGLASNRSQGSSGTVTGAGTETAAGAAAAAAGKEEDSVQELLSLLDFI